MSFRTDLTERWRALFRRNRADRELDEEVAFHLEHDIAARIARGVDAAEARRQAMLAIGGVAQVKEQVRDARGVRPLDDLAGYHILYGRSADDLDRSVFIDGSSVTTYEIASLDAGVWYFAVTAVNASGLEGPASTPAMKSI